LRFLHDTLATLDIVIDINITFFLSAGHAFTYFHIDCIFIALLSFLIRSVFSRRAFISMLSEAATFRLRISDMRFTSLHFLHATAFKSFFSAASRHYHAAYAIRHCCASHYAAGWRNT
jgi:uncharacterized membrane protein